MSPARDPRAAATNALGAAVVLLVAAAAVCVTASMVRRGEPQESSRRFQTLVGGLGLGPAGDLSVCEPDFDPRVGDVCARNVGSVPGAAALCAHRGGSALVR